MRLCISKAYKTQKVFENFELEIAEGEVLCVLGESGGGKTTLLKILSGLTEFEGDIDGLPSSVAYIFQEPRLLPNLSVIENLLYAGAKREEIEDVLRQVEMLALKDKRPKELSGGEKQRVAIARAFLSDAPLLLMDEPFASLDTALKIRLIDVFARLLKERKKTVVFVTHDLEEAWMLGHRVVVLRQGKAVMDIAWKKKEVPRIYGETQAQKAEILALLTR